MTTPISSMAPFYTPMVRMMAMQTRFAIETSQSMMKLAMMPWAGLPAGFGSICTPMGGVTLKTPVSEAAPAAPTPANTPAKTARGTQLETVESTAVEVKEPAKAPAKPVSAAEPAAKPKAEAAPKPKPEAVTAPKPEAEAAPKPKPEATPKAETVAAPELSAEKAPEVDAPKTAKPVALKAPKGEADDLTALNGVGPKLAEALQAEGIYHYTQIAGWSDANVAWADENLPGVRGAASRNGWVAQAADLAK